MLLVVAATVIGAVISFMLCWYLILKTERFGHLSVRIVLFTVCGAAMTLIMAAVIITALWPPRLWGPW